MQAHDMTTKTDQRMVYVKPIEVSELPAEVQAQAEGLETLFAVHNADGEQLAIAASQSLAMTLARKNNLAPQLLH